MFLRDTKSGDLVEVLNIEQLGDPTQQSLKVAYHAGEEKGDPVSIEKSALSFPSGEALPVCWLDPHYRVNF